MPINPILLQLRSVPFHISWTSAYIGLYTPIHKYQNDLYHIYMWRSLVDWLYFIYDFHIRVHANLFLFPMCVSICIDVSVFIDIPLASMHRCLYQHMYVGMTPDAPLFRIYVCLLMLMSPYMYARANIHWYSSSPYAYARCMFMSANLVIYRIPHTHRLCAYVYVNIHWHICVHAYVYVPTYTIVSYCFDWLYCDFIYCYESPNLLWF